MRELSNVQDIKEIKYLNDIGIKINTKQKEILKNYNINKINTINTIQNFSNYLLCNKNNKYIDDEWISKCHEKFNQLIQKNFSPLEYPLLFIDYTLFLITIKKYDHLNKIEINNKIIQIQKLWENKYFNIVNNELTTFTSQEKLTNEEAKQFNNINFLVNICMITKQEQYIAIMQLISESPCSIFNSYYINPSFPLDSNTTSDATKNDIDNCTLEILKNIQKKQNFLNPIDDLYCLKFINNYMISNAKYAFSIFNNTEELYLEIQQKLKNYIPLIDYGSKPQLAHLTQLFPIIEKLIQQIGINYGIVPFKETKTEDFIKFKDSSSILRKILKIEFNKHNNFEYANDLLFVYHYLYNSHSLNIRNECVHGRNYLTGDSLIFALKITLSSLYILINRLDN